MSSASDAPTGTQGRPALRWPCGDADAPEEYGFAMSGGGYRAMLFHLGALLRLNELGMLPKLDRISSVSGGSLMAAFLARAWTDLDFDERGVARTFNDKVVRPVLQFSRLRLDAPIITAGLIPFVDPAALLARRVDREIAQGRTLQDLPDRPRFVFNAAHLSTGSGWRFSKPYMADYRLGAVCEPDVRLADAVAASCAFPPIVSPLTLRLSSGDIAEVEGAKYFHDPNAQVLKERVMLLDGGAYDNLGSEPVQGRCRVVLASDAGGNLRLSTGHFRYSLMSVQLKRILDLAVEHGRAQRRAALVRTARLTRELHETGRVGDPDWHTEHVALWRTAYDPNRDPEMLGQRKVHDGWPRYLSTRSTRMWRMSRDDTRWLVNWGYLLADVTTRRYVPELQGRPAAPSLPFRDHDFEKRPLT